MEALVTNFFSVIAMIVQVGLFVFGGAIVGIVFWRKNNKKIAFLGFGHFLGVIASVLITMWIAREDGSLGIAIIIVYPVVTGICMLVGFLIGWSKDRALQTEQPLATTREDV